MMLDTWQMNKHRRERTLLTSLTRTVMLLALAMSSRSSSSVQASSDSAVVALTPENYDALTEGKIVFIKLFAPWCGHCQELAPKWEQLAKDYAKSDKYMVAEIDCTASPVAETWCDDDFGIEGFPTMLFGDPGRGGALLEEYQDERDYETLAEFAALMFDTPLCNVDHMDGCTDEIRAQLERYMKMSDADINAEIERMETEMDEIDENFEDQMDELQNQYDELATNHQIHVASVNKFLKWIDEIKELKTATS